MKIKTALLALCMMAVGLTAHARFSSINGTNLTIENIYFAADYLTSGGVTDNYAAFQALLNTFTGGETLIFDDNEYYFSDSAYSTVDDITLIGHSTGIIAPDGWFTNRHDPAWYSDLSVSMSSAGPDFTIPDGVSLSVGQYVIIWSSTTYTYYASASSYYYDGVFGRIDKIDGSTATLSHKPHNDFTADKIYVMNIGDNVRVSGFNIDMTDAISSTAPTALSLGGTGAVAEHIRVLCNNYGGAGVSMGPGINGLARDIHVNDPKDTGLVVRMGYGISMAGHNQHVDGFVTRNCKHHITGADRRFWSESFLIENGDAWNDPTLEDTLIDGEIPFLSPFDCHGNVGHVTFRNLQSDTGVYTGSTDIGVFSVRNGSASIDNCRGRFRNESGNPFVNQYEFPLTKLSVNDCVYTADAAAVLVKTAVSGDYYDSSIVDFSGNHFTNITWKGCTLKDNRLYAAAAPTSSDYDFLVGDIVYNSAVSATGELGWICTTAGSPGTWSTIYKPNQALNTTSDVAFDDITASTLYLISTSVPMTSKRNTTSVTNYAYNCFQLYTENTDSGDDIKDGFGPLLAAYIKDYAGSMEYIGAIGFNRDGADNSGAITFSPLRFGGGGEAMRISSEGRIGMYDTDPTSVASIKTPYCYRAYYYNGSTYTDNASEAKTTKGTAFTLLSNYENDAFYIASNRAVSGGGTEPFNSMYLDIATAANGGTLVIKYATGVDGSNNVNAWTSVSSPSDGTIGLTTTGTISWTMPTDWVSGKVNGSTGYWLQITSSSSISTPPTCYAIKPNSATYIASVTQNNGDNTPAFAVRNDGSTALRKKVRIDTAASVTLSADDVFNGLCVNGDDDVIDYTLPDASPSTGSLVGAEVEFYAGGFDQVITIDTYDANDTIYILGASVGAGDAIDTAGDAYNWLKMVCTAPGRWDVLISYGVLSDGGAD